jgi:hypothetical protein
MTRLAFLGGYNNSAAEPSRWQYQEWSASTVVERSSSSWFDLPQAANRPYTSATYLGSLTALVLLPWWMSIASVGTFSSFISQVSTYRTPSLSLLLAVCFSGWQLSQIVARHSTVLRETVENLPRQRCDGRHDAAAAARTETKRRGCGDSVRTRKAVRGEYRVYHMPGGPTFLAGHQDHGRLVTARLWAQFPDLFRQQCALRAAHVTATMPSAFLDVDSSLRLHVGGQ